MKKTPKYFLKPRFVRHSHTTGGNPLSCRWIPGLVRNDGFQDGFTAPYASGERHGHKLDRPTPASTTWASPSRCPTTAGRSERLVIDISTHAEARQRLRGEQLQCSERLASLSEMASALAYELNQPLLTAGLEGIASQVQRAAEIVRRIRTCLKQRALGAEYCQVNDIVAKVMGLMHPETRVRQTSTVQDLQPDLPVVTGDPVLLELVVQNLVLNSLQAMQNTPLERRCIEIETGHSESTVWVRVANHLPGFNDAVAARLFEPPLTTTKSDGLGFTLKVCRTIIESHCGRLRLDSRSARGRTITIQLPLPTADSLSVPQDLFKGAFSRE